MSFASAHTGLTVARQDAAAAPQALSGVARKSAIAQGSFIVMIGLTLGLVMLLVAVVLLRRHHHRVSRMKSPRAEQEIERAKKAVRPDAWSEAARRMDPQRIKDGTSDTVDFDPRELGPEDIWPPDDEPPRNGKHDHSGPNGDPGRTP